jgi:ABC-type proline/glycine betaine transport system substrate-binding protein
MPKIREINGQNAKDNKNRLKNEEKTVGYIKQQPEIIKQKAPQFLKKSNKTN